MSFKKLIFILILLNNVCYSLVENTSIVTGSKIKHQVSIGISKFINSVFASDKNAYDLNYRYTLNEKIHLRAAALYNKDDSDGGFIESGFKFGIDKKLKIYEKWSFYYGIDLIGTYFNQKNINKDQYMIGALPFLGIQYNISKNFSFSIEPALYVRHYIVIDKATFSKDNKTTWTESGLGKLGYITANFHF